MTDRSNAIKAGAGLLAAAALATATFLTNWEPGKDPGLVYPDKLAGGLPTVCKGITRHVTTTPVIVGERWSPEKCQAEELVAISKVQAELLQCFKVVPPVSVLAMATSHGWNVGARNTCNSQAMEAWNRGDWALGCRRLGVSDGGQPVWSYVSTGRKLANGKPEMRFVQGLANRRAAETTNCLEGLPK